MNLKFIKEHGFDDQFIEMLSKKELRNPDQDTLNVICDGYIGYINTIYNFGPINTVAERRANVGKYKIYHMTWYKLWDPKSPGPHYVYNSYYREVLY